MRAWRPDEPRRRPDPRPSTACRAASAGSSPSTTSASRSRPGEILGVIGPNGAGKTTCFEIVAGFTRPDRGRIVFDGIDLTGATPEERAREGLVRSFQDAALFPTLTVHETLMVAQERAEPTRLWTSALGVRSAERDKALAADEVLERMRLTRYARHSVGELSTGTRRVVELACLLTLQPRVLLLDEPSAGIAQSESDALGDLLLAIREELGTTMVVIEHDLPLLSRLSDRMLAMNLGRVIAAGTPDEVRTDPAVVTSYLGADQAAIHRSGLRLASRAPTTRPRPAGDPDPAGDESMTNPEEIDVRSRVTLLSRGLAAVAALLVVLVTAPPSFAAPTLTVSATTGLTDGQTITISGSGFDAQPAAASRSGSASRATSAPRTATPVGGATFKNADASGKVASFTIKVKEKFGAPTAPRSSA